MVSLYQESQQVETDEMPIISYLRNILYFRIGILLFERFIW